MTFFVLGAGGFLGRNLVKDLDGEGCRVVAVGRERARNVSNAPFVSWIRALDEVRVHEPTTVVNAIAIADRARCEYDEEACDEVNHRLAGTIAQVCAEREVPLVQIGTDGLFGQGTTATAPQYFEVDTPTRPIDAYARSKAAAEATLRTIGWGRVLRLSFVGLDHGTGRGLVRFIADTVRSGSPEITGYTDLWFTPVHTRDVAAAIRSEGLPSGFSIRHCASFPAMTKYAFVSEVIATLGLKLRITALKRRPLPGGDRIPVDQTLFTDSPVPASRVVHQAAHDVAAILA